MIRVETVSTPQVAVKNIVRDLDQGHLPLEEENRLLETLEFYECWSPLLRTLSRRLSDTSRRGVVDYIHLARIQNRRLEDSAAAARTAALLVEQMEMDYESFRQEAVPLIVAEDDFGTESLILEAISQVLPPRAGKVACLERLCLIYEKKKYNERMLNESYKRLILADSQNIKALRFFKVVYTQNNEWDEVAKILRTLHTSVRHEGDKYRYAQELATVYLYQLDRPKRAIEVIEKYCSKSHLDTSTIHFEAYSRLGNWEGCLNVLKECLTKVDGAVPKAVLHYKIGELEAQLGKVVEAATNFHLSLNLAPQFLEPFESLIELSLNGKKWHEAVALLAQLQTKVGSPELRQRIEEAKLRLQDGIASVG